MVRFSFIRTTTDSVAMETKFCKRFKIPLFFNASLEWFNEKNLKLYVKLTINIAKQFLRFKCVSKTFKL